MNNLQEIKKLKALAENELIQWLSVLSELEQMEKIELTTKRIKIAFKSKK